MIPDYFPSHTRAPSSPPVSTPPETIQSFELSWYIEDLCKAGEFYYFCSAIFWASQFITLPSLRFFFYFYSTVAAPKVVDLPTAIRNIFLVFLSQTSKLVPPYSLCLRTCRTFLQTLRCSRRTRCIVQYPMSPTTPKTLPYPIFRNTDSLNPTESQAPPSRHHTGLTALCNTVPNQWLDSLIGNETLLDPAGAQLFIVLPNSSWWFVYEVLSRISIIEFNSFLSINDLTFIFQHLNF